MTHFLFTIALINLAFTKTGSISQNMYPLHVFPSPESERTHSGIYIQIRSVTVRYSNVLCDFVREKFRSTKITGGKLTRL